MSTKYDFKKWVNRKAQNSEIKELIVPTKHAVSNTCGCYVSKGKLVSQGWTATQGPQVFEKGDDYVIKRNVDGKFFHTACGKVIN